LGPLGLAARTLDRVTAMRQGIPDAIQGVIVTEVDPAGSARLARVRPGHVILEVNRRPVDSIEAFQAAVAGLAAGDVVAVLLYDRLLDQRLLVTIVPDPAS
jgi:S1-C subfamily serine protease